MRLRLFCFLATICLVGPSLSWGQNPTAIGTLSNFDTVNDTGSDCHGFEIELEGIHSLDVVGAFGGTYNRYGDPEKIDTATGVIVRWAAKWDPVTMTYDTATPIANVGSSPSGHDCYNGGPIGNYLESGCEHFGVSLRQSQTATAYRWLKADPNNAGQLLNGGNVGIPAPLYNVVNNPGVGPLVQARIEAPREPEDQREFGDATWAKLIKTELHLDRDLELNDLFVRDFQNDPDGMGLFDSANEDEETEIEWFIMQDHLNGMASENELLTELQANESDEAIAYRLEFYRYTGQYEAESHEVLLGGDGSGNVPLDGELGDFVGAQMAGVNFNLGAVPEPDSIVLASVGALALFLRRRRS